MPGLLDFSLPHSLGGGGLLGSDQDALLQLAAMRGFSPQGYTGGGVNMPGRLSNGQPALQRSEGTEYERATRDLQRNPPPSILGSMINPQQASLVSAIREAIMRRQMETGYGWNYPATMNSGQQP